MQTYPNFRKEHSGKMNLKRYFELKRRALVNEFLSSQFLSRVRVMRYEFVRAVRFRGTARLHAHE